MTEAAGIGSARVKSFATLLTVDTCDAFDIVSVNSMVSFLIVLSNVILISPFLVLRILLCPVSRMMKFQPVSLM